MTTFRAKSHGLLTSTTGTSENAIDNRVTAIPEQQASFKSHPAGSPKRDPATRGTANISR
jgi:hypothetical protein